MKWVLVLVLFNPANDAEISRRELQRYDDLNGCQLGAIRDYSAQEPAVGVGMRFECKTFVRGDGGPAS